MPSLKTLLFFFMIPKNHRRAGFENNGKRKIMKGLNTELVIHTRECSEIAYTNTPTFEIIANLSVAIIFLKGQVYQLV